VTRPYACQLDQPFEEKTLSEHNPAHDDQYQRGLATRREVMGDAFVDRALTGTTPFTQPIQDHISRNAWGDVWQREGLDRKTRSLVTVAMLTALGKQNELKGHVRGALNNGATVQEIQEVLLHAAVYCGVPTSVEAFRSAAEVVEAVR
jgi:4-carboxymuconolactone decarboxylase